MHPNPPPDSAPAAKAGSSGGAVPLTTIAAPILVIGGAHSGKSELAMQFLAPDQPALIIGTAPPDEPAFATRLSRLRQLRPAAWETAQGGSDLAASVAEAVRYYPQIMIDSISQWIAALTVAGADGGRRDTVVADSILSQIGELTHLISQNPRVRIVFVSAEVGSSPAPARGLERLYRQQVGLVNQHLAKSCPSVLTVTAGIPNMIKGPSPWLG